MRSFPTILLLSACSALVACSSSDDGGSPGTDDSGVAVDTSSSDTHVVVDSSHDVPSETASDVGHDAPADGTTDGASDTAPDVAPETDDADASDAILDDVALDAPKLCDAIAGDCPAGQYCDAVACGHGTCKPAPTSPSVDLAPVCGCDGVTFWNAEQAQNAGVSYTDGACEIAASTTRHCGGSIGGACPGTDTCIADHSSTGTCPAPTVGSTCWFIPAGVSCSSSDPKTYRDCGDTSCRSYCDVLMSGDAFYSDATCP